MSPSEPFCEDCPDHEACATGWPCDKVKSVDAQMRVSKHVHVARPGEENCFVCGRDVADAARADAGLPPIHSRQHDPIEREYGPDQVVLECRRCGVEWPCPAIKAINRNAARARRNRK